MHKDGKWAKKIVALQEDDGKWGWFHSLSRFSDKPITTEQALRRLERLGYTMEDACIQKAVAYMDSCLAGQQAIPDPREKLHDWDIFTAMILSTWIRRFTPDNSRANDVAEKWAKIVMHAFTSGKYCHEEYVAAYREVWGMRPNGGRLIDFVSFYQVSLLCNCLDEKTENALVDYILNKEDGIYYIYDEKLAQVPACFEGLKASRYLGAIELLADYKCAREKLQFVADWLLAQRNADGKWDMGAAANDKIYFPLADNWRKKEVREADCTERMEALLRKIM